MIQQWRSCRRDNLIYALRRCRPSSVEELVLLSAHEEEPRRRRQGLQQREAVVAAIPRRRRAVELVADEQRRVREDVRGRRLAVAAQRARRWATTPPYPSPTSSTRHPSPVAAAAPFSKTLEAVRVPLYILRVGTVPSLDLRGVSQSTQALRQLVAKVRAAGTRRDHEGAGRVEAVLARRRRGARLRDGLGGRRVAWPGDGGRRGVRVAPRRRRLPGRGAAPPGRDLSTPGGSSSSAEAGTGSGRVHAVRRVACS